MVYDDINKTITTERLFLRLFEESDAETVTKLCNNYNIYKSTLTLPYPYTIDCALSWIEHHIYNFNADKSYEFAICDRQTGTLYGAIALSNNQRYENGELAYWIGEEFWGNGYVTEASKAILDFAFNVKKYHKVYARHFASNPASGRVIQKVGMIKEGILIDHVKKENQYEHLIYYGVVKNKLG
ncbi:GNAT family N-acetyltransferase [Paenibacillus sp. N3/727]|uniref:GNAT family N-acetyltransferase n=1 Tax=Paenibacillus sp. N3/727 TaxID=2925845 RepID=UPI001F539936|nr:GNAT family N-acetyltransferase [Paenibacillus sp. N3/727]UNK18633.1 GNAT family N-acetyltransferase [Paenibacillus sp. N3/727]